EPAMFAPSRVSVTVVPRWSPYGVTLVRTGGRTRAAEGMAVSSVTAITPRITRTLRTSRTLIISSGPARHGDGCRDADQIDNLASRPGVEDTHRAIVSPHRQLGPVAAEGERLCPVTLRSELPQLAQVGSRPQLHLPVR